MYNIRTFLFCFLHVLIACTFAAQPIAQPTAIAVMEARVNIISGVGISAINSTKAPVPEIISNLVDLGSFVVTTLPGIDISAQIKNTFTGELKESMFSRLSAQVSLTEMGTRLISLTGLLSDEQLNIRQKENISIVVEYL